MGHLDGQTPQDPVHSPEKKMRFASKIMKPRAGEGKTAGLFAGSAWILLSIIKRAMKSILDHSSSPSGSAPRWQLLECLSIAKPLGSSLRPRAPPLDPCSCPPSPATSLLSSALSLGASCKNEYFKIHPPGGPLQVEKYHPFGNLTPFQG